MRIGLIDVDGHNFPNLALMRISSYHKRLGDTVEWWSTNYIHYDIVYMSRVFSDSYSKDVQEPTNCDKVVKGGTGYSIKTENGIEFLGSNHKVLPVDIEMCKPDYSIYPQFNYAVSMTTRGCPRSCKFCHVSKKEGIKSVKVAEVSDFLRTDCSTKLIKVLDPNILACKDKRKILQDYINTGLEIDFTQGLDIRLIDDCDIRDINNMKTKEVHFAWDNAEDSLEDRFRYWAKNYNKKSKGTVYVLTNFSSSFDQDMYRVIWLKENGFKPFVMVYNKPSAPLETKRLQAWCNNKILFNKIKKFEDVRFVSGNTNIIRTERSNLDERLI